MHQRSVYASILLLALLTSAAQNVLATAFCPSFGRPHAACDEMVAASGESHSGMTHEMHEMEATDQVDKIAPPLDDCIHCVTRSNPPRSTLSLGQTSTFQCPGHVAEPDAIAAGSYLDLIPRLINAREHAPPPHSSPLHVRLNVFRI